MYPEKSLQGAQPEMEQLWDGPGKALLSVPALAFGTAQAASATVVMGGPCPLLVPRTSVEKGKPRALDECSHPSFLTPYFPPTASH